VAGLVRSVQGEYPGAVTLSTAGTGDHAPVLVPRLVPAAPDMSLPRTWAIDPDRTVLITGGTGALGAVLARHLVVAHSARHLVLASRRGLEAPGARELLSDLTAHGSSVRIVACDVADAPVLRRLIESCDRPLGAVVHTAGVLDDGVVIAQNPARFERVLAPKAYAAWTLHEATRELDLSAFVLYSSAAGLLNRPGQANYAAANAFLDALARHRRALGLPAVSLAWGPWEQEGGMANQSADGVPERFRGHGVRALTSAAGLALFDASQYSDEAVLAPILLEPDRKAHPRTSPNGAVPPPAPASGAWRRLLADQPSTARRRVLESLIRTELAALVGYQEDDELLAERGFAELGFDSLTSLQARSLLVDRTGVQLPVTIMFENPTLPELAAAIESELELGSRPGPDR
jgi:KR domain/Phosphopantetheine attachment site